MPESPDLLTTHAGRAIAEQVDAARSAGSLGPWVVAFSGGTDSLALALGLAAARRARGETQVEVHLVHVDHQMDGGSTERAEAARSLAARLSLPYSLERRNVPSEKRPGENVEAAARRIRYEALEDVRQRLGADRILTAHHLDDQIETILLRLRSGSGLLGLTGIRERRGALWRPLLALGRSDLAELLARTNLDPLQDPGNDDLARDRNHLRHRVLPRLLAENPDLYDAVRRLALRAAGWRPAFEQRWIAAVDIEANNSAASLDLEKLLELPPSPALFALQVLENRAGRRPPTSTRAKLELLRQLRQKRETRRPRDLGRGQRIRPDGRLELERPTAAPAEPRLPFSYTVAVPGEVEIPELGGRMRLEMRAVEDWMYRGEKHRAALRLPGGSPPAQLEVRNRRPGDRLRPLGAPGMRRLKDLLIDRKAPREERDRIPLLVVGGRIAWVPGITIAEEFRLQDDREALVACWVANPGTPSRRSSGRGALIARPEEDRI